MGGGDTDVKSRAGQLGVWTDDWRVGRMVKAAQVPRFPEDPSA